MLRFFGHFLFICILMIAVSCSPPTINRQNIKTNEISEEKRYAINIPSPAGDVPSLEFQMQAPFPVFPDQIQVHQLVKPEITAKKIADIGAKLGLTNEVKQSNREFFIQDGNKSLEMFTATGGILFSNMGEVPKEKPILPSDKEAEAIATDILGKIGQLPPGLNGTSQGVGESMGDWPISLIIGFKRNIGGEYFTGPGAKYQVRIGDRGAVRQIMINPVQYVPKEIVKIKTVEQAFQEMKTAKKYSAPSGAKKVIIDNIAIAYWLEPMTIGQDYIAPVYCFSGQCLDASNKQLKSKFAGYEQAIK